MTADAESSHVGLVVEGRGDGNSLPLLLRNWLQLRGDYRDVLGKPVICNGRDKALVPNGLEGYVAAAASRPGCKALLVVLDGEGDQVCSLGPSLLERTRVQLACPVAISLADESWEDWLYASIETLGLGDLTYNPNVSGNGQLVKALKPKKYVKPTLQPRLTSRMDIPTAMDRSPSLRRMLGRFDELLRNLPE